MVASENGNTITADLEILNHRIYKILFVVRHFSKSESCRYPVLYDNAPMERYYNTLKAEEVY